MPHDVNKDNGPGPDFESGTQGGMNEGDTYELTFDRGRARSTTSARVHAPGMAGTITVK